MRLSRNESLGRSLVGALAALLAMALLGSGSARASCSHYVLMKHANLSLSGEQAGLEMLELASDMNLAKPAEGGTSGQPGKPCTGVFCSGSPATPSPPVPTLLPTSELWGLNPKPTLQPGAGSFLRHGGEPRVRPIHVDLSVFHPPRSLSAIG